MVINESFIQASDGTRLYLREWGDPSGANAIIVLLHGVGEHCQRYEHVARQACERGFFMLGYDRRGHGRSEGKQGLIGSVDQLVADFSQVIAVARAKTPRCRSSCMGTAWARWGCCITLCARSRR